MRFTFLSSSIVTDCVPYVLVLLFQMPYQIATNIFVTSFPHLVTFTFLIFSAWSAAASTSSLHLPNK